MSTNFDQIEHDALDALAAAADSAALDTWRMACLGRSAPLMAALGTLAALEQAQRWAFTDVARVGPDLRLMARPAAPA